MKRSRGFTLLEILMVLVIIGAVLSMVGLVSPLSPERQARQEAGQLIQLLQAARESAVLEGSEHGVRLEPRAYRLLRLEGDAWVARGASHGLPAGISVSVQVTGLPLALQPGGVQPQLLALSSDEYSPFELEFQHQGERLLSVRGDGLADPVIHEG